MIIRLKRGMDSACGSRTDGRFGGGLLITGWSLLLCCDFWKTCVVVGLTINRVDGYSCGSQQQTLYATVQGRPLPSSASSSSSVLFLHHPIIILRNRPHSGGVLKASSLSSRSYLDDDDDDYNHNEVISTTQQSMDDDVTERRASSAANSCYHQLQPTNTNIHSAVRLNKVFKATHSRREADRMITQGRVTVNGVVSMGDMVIPFHDVIALDGRIVHEWEQMNGIQQKQQIPVVAGGSSSSEKPSRNDYDDTTVSDDEGDVVEFNSLSSSRLSSTTSLTTTTTTNNFEYVKYYKPRGVICTTDRKIDGNILDAIIGDSGYQPKHRVYPVGRLDRASSGLILLTSDGRLPNASLRKEQKQPKVYHVTVDHPLTKDAINDLRSGVVITTVAQRDGTSKPLTARTKPCIVKSLDKMRMKVEMVLEEGRNRQIRKMMAVLGYEVQRLHRIRFGKIELDRDMVPGDWKELNSTELDWIESMLLGQHQQQQ